MITVARAHQVVAGAITILTVSSANAGGNQVLVEIVNLDIKNKTSFHLIVRPEQNSDSFMSKCKLFTVIGKYAFKEGAAKAGAESNVRNGTRQEHIAALSVLQEAKIAGKTINFGWMGGGFQPVDPKKCVYSSLSLRRRGSGESHAVISYESAD